MSQPDTNLNIRSRPTTTLNLTIPIDTLASLERVAQSRDMSVDALIKFYVGQQLRHDLATLFSQHVLDLTADVLAKHGQSEEQVAEILREIRAAAK